MNRHQLSYSYEWDMIMRKLLAAIVAMGLAATAIALSINRPLLSGMHLIVYNNSGGTINGVSIQYIGSSNEVDEINDGNRKRYSITPGGETDIRLQFQEQNGTHHEQIVHPYVEPAFGGTIVIEIKNDYSIISKGDFTVPMIPSS